MVTVGNGVHSYQDAFSSGRARDGWPPHISYAKFTLSMQPIMENTAAFITKGMIIST